MDNITAIKASIVAICGALSAVWGWFGWLIVAFIGCMAIDFITGSLAAFKKGEWKSSRGREGLWHKTGCIIAVLVALILDKIVGSAINNIPSITLPFIYSVMIAPVVIVWYILTELGSIIENVGQLGAPVPGFLQKGILILKGAADAAGNKIVDGVEESKPPDRK